MIMKTIEDGGAYLNRRQFTNPGMSLREAVEQHLGAYLPGAVGPTAWQIAQVFCAGKAEVEAALTRMGEDGTVQAYALAADDIDRKRREVHWELA
jgi:hypothetical protein